MAETLDAVSRGLASIIIVSYNSRKDLVECVPSLLNQSYLKRELIIVDNASSDGSCSFIRDSYPEITLIESGGNLGYAEGNNLGFKYSRGEYIIIVNPDTAAHHYWLEELIKPLEKDPDVSMTSSKILLYDQRDKVNTCANTTHYCGLDFCNGFKDHSAKFNTDQEVGAVSGCSFAIRRSVFDQLGGFDPDFFMYMEDIDISLRARLVGYKILLAPTSVIYHKFSLNVHPQKIFFLERNRYLMILKNYRLKILLLSLPALLITEVMTLGYAVTRGLPFILYKFKAYWWLATNLGGVLAKRRNVQKHVKITEKDFIKFFDWYIPFDQMIDNWLLRAVTHLVFNTFYYTFYTFVIQKV